MLESNQRGSPSSAGPEPNDTAGKSPKRAFLAGAVLTASLVVALGALSGTAAAETSSTDPGEAIASARQMATDMVQSARQSSAVNTRSSDRSAVTSRSTPVSSDSRIDVSEMARSFTAAASSSDPVKAAVAEVSAVIHEIEARTSQSVGASSISEPETTSSMTIASVEEEPAVMAEVTPATNHDVNQCNPPEFPGDTAGWEVTCDVEIVNTITPEGDESSVVTTRTCLAAEGVLPPFGCTTEVQEHDQLTTSVDQCNGIAYGGGSNVTCTVEVINNVPVGTPTTGVTVNQCNGTGDAVTACDPEDASTTGATVNQCNNSAYGGGSTVICTVSGEETAVPLTINQCNDSAYGGGDTVKCDVTVTNNFIEAGGETPDGETPDGETPDGETPDGDGPTDGEPGTGGPVTGGPVTGRPVTGRPGTTVPEGTSPVAVVPAAFVTPVVPAPAASQPELARAGTATEGASSSTGTSTLPATGSDIGSMTALALLVMMLGGLLILTSRSASKATAKS